MVWFWLVLLVVAAVGLIALEVTAYRKGGWYRQVSWGTRIAAQLVMFMAAFVVGISIARIAQIGF